MELTELQLVELVQINLEDAVWVDSPDAINAFNHGTQIFDVSHDARKLDRFVTEHLLRNRIDYDRKLPPGNWPYPFERFWDQPVYLIHEGGRQESMVDPQNDNHGDLLGRGESGGEADAEMSAA